MYFDAYLGKTYGAAHTIFQMIVVAAIVGCSIGAFHIIHQNHNRILPCGRTEYNYGTYNYSSISLDPMATPSEERLFWSRQALDEFCGICQAMQAWLCLICL